jgi:predicted XRE-type DNA-binding protein
VIKALTDNKSCTLKLRIIDAITAKATEKGWSQKDIATLLETTQPRVSNLFNYQIDKFSLDKLFNYMYLLDIEVLVLINGE